MNALFKTVLILSVLGSGVTLFLLFFKPITVKKFPAKWQYYVWIVALLTMLIPTYNLVPDDGVQKIRHITNIVAPQNDSKTFDVNILPSETSDTLPVTERKINLPQNVKIKLFDLAAVIWIFGVSVFLLVALISYFVYIFRRRKNSILLENSPVLFDVKKELKIHRNIRVRMSSDIASPMLVGVFFPVVYMPCRQISNNMMRLIFLHELTHYKRKDLIVKWFALFVNAIHWFNPFAYLLSANLSEACEISCDMEVTKNMSDEQQKLYMKTILELVE